MVVLNLLEDVFAHVLRDLVELPDLSPKEHFADEVGSVLVEELEEGLRVARVIGFRELSDAIKEAFIEVREIAQLQLTPVESTLGVGVDEVVLELGDVVAELLREAGEARPVPIALLP